MNLLDYYHLQALQAIKLQAEWIRWIGPNDPCQAKIELKLTPLNPPTPVALEYVVQARLECVGLPSADQPLSETLFRVEIVMNANYRASGQLSLSFEEFSRHHLSLNRQLYPLLHQYAHSLLQTLGLSQIRLPPDLSNDEPAAAVRH